MSSLSPIRVSAIDANGLAMTKVGMVQDLVISRDRGRWSLDLALEAPLKTGQIFRELLSKRFRVLLKFALP